MTHTPPLLDTEDAITLLVGDAPPGVRAVIRKRLYMWAQERYIVNYGGTGRGQARWDIRELTYIRNQRIMVP